VTNWCRPVPPSSTQALRKTNKDGLTHVILDGTLIHTDRVKADRPYFSGKHRVHGMKVQVIVGPDGTILWTSGALPGSVHGAGLRSRPVVADIDALEVSKGKSQIE
jgi:hypothetical protein